MRKLGTRLSLSALLVLLAPASISQTPATETTRNEPAADSPSKESPTAQPDVHVLPPQSDLVLVPPPPLQPKRPITEEERRQRQQEAKRIRADRHRGKPAKPPAAATTRTPEEELDFKIRADVELVLLDVSVKDSQGGFISGLQKENFKVFDNRIEQDISIFQSQDVPVTVGMVVDNSGSVRPKKDEIITAALTFVRDSNPQDEMFIVNFNDFVSTGLPAGTDFTANHKLLRDALLLNPAQGRTALYDGLKTALRHLEKGRLDKKTLILIADGGDNMSDTSEAEILNLVEESLATIYTIGIYNPDDKDKNPGFLRKIAAISGGQYHHPPDMSHLVSICSNIAKDIRNRYTLGYSPASENFDGTIRKLRVLATNVNGDKLQVRTRNQYVASRESRPRDQQ